MHGRRICHIREESPHLGFGAADVGVYTIAVRFPPLWLNPGLYSLYFKATLWNDSGSARHVSERFPLGPFPQLAAARWNLCVLHTVPDDFLATYAPLVDGTVQWRPLVSYRDTPASYLLRAATSYAHLYWADTFAMRRKRNAPVRGSWGMRSVHHLARVAGRLAASPLGMRALDRWHQASVAKRPEVAGYRELFERVRPSVLLCSHQRPTVVLPAVLAARALDIPTATCIFSWDNLTSKGRIAAPFDYYLVWSEHMRREFRRYYPAISPERVHVVGTPQFDPYADRGLLWERSVFFGRIHADPARPLICYSGGDVGTTPDDPQHVRILMELIRAGAIPRGAQVLLRPAPGDPGDRFQGVCRDHPKLIFAPPAWVHTRPGDWTGVLPLPPPGPGGPPPARRAGTECPSG